MDSESKEKFDRLLDEEERVKPPEARENRGVTNLLGMVMAMGKGPRGR